MSEIKYGLISKKDGETLERTLDLIMFEFPNDVINVTEIGLFDGGTTRGVQEYIHFKKRNYFYTGIDNEKDKSVEPISLYYENLIIGNSSEAYNQLPVCSQHLIIIDGNHSFPHVVSDFFCYQRKVEFGGFIAFHDAGRHIAAFTDYQGVGDLNDMVMFISVRHALGMIGLLDNQYYGWELVFDEADETDRAGGFCVFKRVR